MDSGWLELRTARPGRQAGQQHNDEQLLAVRPLPGQVVGVPRGRPRPAPALPVGPLPVAGRRHTAAAGYPVGRIDSRVCLLIH